MNCQNCDSPNYPHHEKCGKCGAPLAVSLQVSTSSTPVPSLSLPNQDATKWLVVLFALIVVGYVAYRLLSDADPLDLAQSEDDKAALGVSIALFFTRHLWGALYAFVIGFAGAPGALLQLFITRKNMSSSEPRLLPKVLSVIGQFTAMLIYTSSLFATLAHLESSLNVLSLTVARASVFIATGTPASIVWRDSLLIIAHRNKNTKDSKLVQAYAGVLNRHASFVPRLIFLFLPRSLASCFYDYFLF